MYTCPYSLSLPPSFAPSLLQVAGEGFSEETQCYALSLLLLATQHSLLAELEFEQQEGVGLIQQVLRSPQAAVGRRIAEVRRGEGEGEGRGGGGEGLCKCSEWRVGMVRMGGCVGGKERERKRLSSSLPPCCPVQVFIRWCCGFEGRTVQNVSILECILLDWRIWHRAPEEVCVCMGARVCGRACMPVCVRVCARVDMHEWLCVCV